jgi:hypothetical protein
MSKLMAEIRRLVEAQATMAHHCLSAAGGRIDQAEALAARLNSQDLHARAGGTAAGSNITVWVSVGPVEADRLSAALTRLNLIEIDRIPCHHDYEIRLQGYDITLYVLPATSEIPE